MLLSVERVLKLLSEGKSAEKIAEMAEIAVEEVYKIIIEARDIVLSTDKERARKKVIIKRQKSIEDKDDIFEGAELSAVPLESSLVIYTDGASSGNPGPAGIGLVIFDHDDRQVGKSLTSSAAKQTISPNTRVIYARLKSPFIQNESVENTHRLRAVVKQITGEYKVKNDTIRGLFDEVMALKSKINNFKIEHVTRNLNDKADYLAKKSIS
jgi:ribonuclease HI